MQLSYSNPALDFPAAAALTAAAFRRCRQLAGEPQLWALLDWLRDEGAAVVEAAGKRMAKVGSRGEALYDKTSSVPGGWLIAWPTWGQGGGQGDKMGSGCTAP